MSWQYSTAHWRRQLWRTGERAPSTSNNLIFSLNFGAAQSLTATLCGCLSKHFVFCVSSCGSSVAGTWTLFIVLLRVILCATKKGSCAPDPGDVTDYSWRETDRQGERERDVQCSWESQGRWQRTPCHKRTAESCTAQCPGRRRHPGPRTARWRHYLDHTRRHT